MKQKSGCRGGKHLLPPLIPPVPFCELCSVFRIFSTNLAMLLYWAVLSNFLMTNVIRMSFVHIKKDLTLMSV